MIFEVLSIPYLQSKPNLFIPKYSKISFSEIPDLGPRVDCRCVAFRVGYNMRDVAEHHIIVAYYCRLPLKAEMGSPGRMIRPAALEDLPIIG